MNFPSLRRPTNRRSDNNLLKYTLAASTRKIQLRKLPGALVYVYYCPPGARFFFLRLIKSNGVRRNSFLETGNIKRQRTHIKIYLLHVLMMVLAQTYTQCVFL